MLRPTHLAVLVALTFVPPQAGRAQVLIRPGGGDFEITPAQRAEAIDGVLKELNQSYVFPDVAKQMEKAIRKRRENKEYDKITRAAELVKTLTEHLREVCHDKHLRVIASSTRLPVMERKGTPPPGEIEKMRERLRKRGDFGFKKLERLDGNIGYMKLDVFAPPSIAGEAAVTAMSFLSGTRALIIDLRDNRGGTPEMVALLCTYFFDGPPVHLNDLYSRPNDTTHQWWTLPYVPGKRYVGKDVYVLTSKGTFSAAEEFAYDLQALKRATLVGETTGGGAHPVGPRRVNDHFLVVVPMGRAINPITKTNWEGAGVKPDVATPAARALQTAYLAALKKELEKARGGPEEPALKKLVETVQGEVEGRGKKEE